MSVDFKTMRSAILESSLRLHVASNGKIIPTRGVNRKRMLEMATEITKMQYKNTLAECERAANDIMCARTAEEFPSSGKEA